MNYNHRQDPNNIGDQSRQQKPQSNTKPVEKHYDYPIPVVALSSNTLSQLTFKSLKLKFFPPGHPSATIMAKDCIEGIRLRWSSLCVPGSDLSVSCQGRASRKRI
ncbi:hypothetical protein FRX31_024123 [Thalictrum thalictroides]|uniref:Uncharacterized protein n=1 Tax=Thalictrum thalictroides TaxID=46969 RepID=A0A7J6VMF5_THATH|nr:hypothetical protein FRX31_024123 [Thalictrum thalictroides]